MADQNFLSQTPDFNLWLRFALANFAADVNCVSIGTIQAFDATTQTATVSINYLKVVKGANPNLPNPAPNDQTSDVYLQYPLLIKCPVVVLQGGGAYLTFPIQPGDTGLVFFNDRELDTWLETGQISYPHNLRTHDLSDAIFLGGIRNLTNSISNYNTSVASLVDGSGERLAQSGFLQAYAGSAAPSGWLLCYGQSLVRATYPTLFAVIGTTYGSADGTHFNVPDLRGRVPVALDNMGGSNANVLTNAFTPNRNILGGGIGEQTHLLTGPESGIQRHHHTYQRITNAGGGDPGSGETQSFATVNTSDAGDTDAVNAHYNVQPGMMFNWIIKI